MMLRFTLLIRVLGIVATLIFIGLPFHALAGQPPNILFILTDQHHANMLSSAGNPYLKTHALDSLARSGIRFARAYVTNPVCVPSRISMATGMMAGRFGVFTNGQKASIPRQVSANSLGKLIKGGAGLPMIAIAGEVIGTECVDRDQ